ncbi:F0F1 ATP synthase subunit A [Luteolibacter sp. AS25]|uniref:F0F1 ATP synthase subunit A n=1 Tax=Luteolibacter sp. AS25 TaxID=3135776 RepID=UPI00398B05B3
MMRFLRPILTFWILCLASAYGAEGEHHALPLNADPLHPFLPISNSMIMVWGAVGIIVLFCRLATKKMSLVPAGLQNFAEWVVEALYDFLEGLIGEHMIKKTFWFFGATFFFILVSNWMGLIPGVGTIGWHQYDAEGNHRWLSLLRGANADLNLTAAMAITFAILWFYWAVTENGIKGFLGHIFAPKGNFGGLILILMVPVFLFVGFLEVISIMIRPVALSFRLYGNIYGGEQTLEALMALIPSKLQMFISWMPALPFYFVELLVGFVQALVFTLLCAIFLKLICDHGDEDHAH